MATAKEAEHILRPVKGQHVFQLHMGASIHSLKELAEALDLMAEKSFQHHVTESRNDFSNWVKDVLGDDELAAVIHPLRGREAILKKLDDRIEQLEHKLAESHVTTKELMSMGAVDFVIGLIIGFIGGLIVAMMVAV